MVNFSFCHFDFAKFRLFSPKILHQPISYKPTIFKHLHTFSTTPKTILKTPQKWHSKLPEICLKFPFEIDALFIVFRKIFTPF